MDNSSAVVEQTFIPVRRALARLLDQLLIAVAWAAFQTFVLGIRENSLLGSFCFYVGSCLILLLGEPTLLSTFGATPGKAVFGINVRDNYGGKLTWRQAFRRTLEVWLRGLGLNLAPLTFVCLLIRGIKVLRGQDMPWDFSTSVLVKDDNKLRYLLFALVLALLLGLDIYLGILSGNLYLVL